MLSIGWPEMMIVAAAALIIVGPRDLPALLKTVGQMAGRVRRMSNDFRREINKAVAMDEVRDIKKSVTQPLTDARKSINSEFNKIGADGKTEPTGALKPTDPKSESVYEEIQAIAKPKAEAKAPVKTGAASKTAASKTAAKPAARKPSTSKTSTSKSTSKAKPTAKAKTAAAKPAAKMTAKAKPAAKMTAKTKPAAKKPAAKKTSESAE